MESDAEAYSRLNKPQFDAGCDFVRILNLSEGSKVLDIGCGTGDVTNFIASLVGPRGEVVGVDPDQARIKIAQEKFKDVSNLTFLVGDSSSNLPHEEEPYYDLHFSSLAFHWLVGDEKRVYIKKAYQCLKQGGRLAFLTAFKNELYSVPDVRLEYLSETDYIRWCDDYGFRVVARETFPFVARYSNYDEFKAWFRASCHRNFSDCDPAFVKLWLETLKIEVDGSASFEIDGMIRIIAEKQCS